MNRIGDSLVSTPSCDFCYKEPFEEDLDLEKKEFIGHLMPCGEKRVIFHGMCSEHLKDVMTQNIAGRCLACNRSFDGTLSRRKITVGRDLVIQKLNNLPFVKKLEVALIKDETVSAEEIDLAVENGLKWLKECPEVLEEYNRRKVRRNTSGNF